MIDNPIFQKKLFSFLRHICVYFTFFIVAFILVQVWSDGIIEEKIFVKMLGTYFLVLVGSVVTYVVLFSLILWNKFSESNKK